MILHVYIGSTGPFILDTDRQYADGEDHRALYVASTEELEAPAVKLVHEGASDKWEMTATSFAVMLEQLDSLGAAINRLRLLNDEIILSLVGGDQTFRAVLTESDGLRVTLSGLPSANPGLSDLDRVWRSNGFLRIGDSTAGAPLQDNMIAAKGDLIVGLSNDNPSILSAPAEDGKVLISDAAEDLGVRWGYILASVTLPDEINAAGLPVSNPPTQAEVVAIRDEVIENRAAIRSIIQAMQ